MIPVDWPLGGMALLLASTYLLLSSQASTPFHQIHISHNHIVSSQITLVIYIIQFSSSISISTWPISLARKLALGAQLMDLLWVMHRTWLQGLLLQESSACRCLAIRSFLGCKYKTWSFMIAMLLGCSCEVVGYLGRILMHNNPYKLSTLVSLAILYSQNTDIQRGFSSKLSASRRGLLSIPREYICVSPEF